MKKLRNTKGFTLTEMLIAVMLLGFVCALVTAMTSRVLEATVTMQEVAQAEILGSEVFDNLQGQLRVAQKIEVNEKANDGKGITFDIDSANVGYTFAVKDGKIVLGHGKDGVITEENKGTPPFGGVSYGNLSVKSLEFAASGEDSIKISVSISYGEKTLWSGDVTVTPLNGMTIV